MQPHDDVASRQWQGGEALATWFFTYAIIVAIVMVWYLTRCGTAFGWW